MNNLMKDIFSKHLFLILLLLALFGCNAPKNHLAKFDNYIGSGNIEKACTFAQKKIHEKGSPRGEDLLWSLQLGSAERFQNRLSQSNEYFDTCEDIMTHFDAENSGLGHAVGSLGRWSPGRRMSARAARDIAGDKATCPSGPWRPGAGGANRTRHSFPPAQ